MRLAGARSLDRPAADRPQEKARMTLSGTGPDGDPPPPPTKTDPAVSADVLADLVERVAANRDRDAFIRLFDHYAPRIKGYLVRLGAEGELAEELTQEVMITLWRKASLFDRSKSSVATWLFRIARNRRIDAIRRDRSGRIDAEDPTMGPEAPPDPDEEIDAASREARVRDALAALPEEQVRLIRLSFFQGLSHSQIASETGLPLGTVKSRIRLAFGRLRKVLESDERVDPPD